jgi:Flp pilus assembly protein TadG
MKIMNARHQRGFVTIWVVLTLAVVLLLVGLAIDTSHAYTVGRELQNAADSAALAGAAQINNGTSLAQAAAVSAASDNKAAGNAVGVSSANDIVFGAYNSATGSFTAGLTPYNAVQVTTRMTSGGTNNPMPLSFGRLVGLSTANITRVAVAYLDTTQGSGVVVLNNSGSTTTPYTQTSSSTVSVSASGGSTGGVWVNSCGGSGGNCSVTNSSCCSGTHLHCCGGCTRDDTSTVPSKCVTSCQPVSDPCAANLSAPSSYGTDQGQIYVGASQQNSSYTCSSNGGYFSQGIYVQNGGTLNLSPGTYIVGSNGVNVDNGCTLNAPNCTFVLTCGSGTQCGCLKLSGGCNCNLTPPTTGTYRDCSVCCCDNSCPASTESCCCGGNCGCDQNNSLSTQADSNNSNNTNGNICVGGTVYCPHYKCHCCGCGCKGGSCQLGNQVICDSMTVDTGSQVTVAYDGRNQVGVAGISVNLVK